MNVTGSSAAAAAITYDVAQAEIGQNVVRTKCAACHGEALGGGSGPPLTGAAFWASWEHRSARKLYSKIISTMPQDNPGTLTQTEVLAVVAYLFRLNGYPAAGDAIKEPDSLNTLIIEKTAGAL